jgi:DHA3 family macrolide efflux protein-like MFS transporter
MKLLMDEKPSFSSVIKNRNFRFLWINQILIQLSYNTLNFALIIWVFKLTGSNLAVSILMLCVYLPSFIFGLFAGVFVDITDRRKIILYIDFIFAVAFLLFAVVKNSYPLLLLNTFFVNSLAQFFMPTESSSIPLLVPKKQLFYANSLFTLTLYGSFMVGFSLAGPILGYFNTVNSVFIVGFMAMSLAWVLSQNLPSINAADAKTAPKLFSAKERKKILAYTLSETKESFNFIRGKLSILVAIGILAGIQGVIGVLAVLISAYMERVLHIHATDASYVLIIPLGLGMVLGAYLIGRFAINIPKRYIIQPAVILAGILFCIMGIIPYVAPAIQAADLPSYVPNLRFFPSAPSLSTIFAFGAFILGICTVSMIVPAQTVLQENTNEKNRGKIFSVLMILMNGVAAIPVVLTGLLSDLFGASPIFIFLGVLIFIIGVVGSRPALFFNEKHLPLQLRAFLGLGHWKN